MNAARFELAPGYTISRVIKGGWQLAGGHGAVDRAQALRDMWAFVEAGITTFDCADIYTGVEELIGAFLAEYRPERAGKAPVQVHTKLVPDRSALAILTREDVRRAVERSLARLGTERLDLVQLHWWDYDVPGWLDAALWLEELRREGLVRHVGLTNFDVPRVSAIVDAGVRVASHQVQDSVVDRRPEGAMKELCARHGIGLLAYGTVLGGLVSERYRNAPAPQPPFENRSLTKYMLIVEEAGGWPLFQDLLRALDAVARRHGTDVATVATRRVLDRIGVAAAIVGARDASHAASNRRILDLVLEADDLAAIDGASEALFGPRGDVYALERVKGGPHASVMRYELNTAAPGHA